MSTTGNITQGHKLFTEWAADFGGQNVSEKPTVRTMKKLLREMNMYGIVVEGYKLRKTHQGLWPYMVHSKVPCTPPQAVRKVIAYISRDTVPVTTWNVVLYNVGRKEKS